MTRTGLGLGLAFGLMATACGGGDDGGAGETVTVDISAEQGGEVEIGGARLTIPAGALAEDTTITATTAASDGLPGSTSLTGLAYDFGPDGTTFLMPVTLELPMVGSAGEGQEAVVSWLDGDAWNDVPTEVADGKVVGTIEHFTTFIVRFRDAGPISCELTACGGDVAATWDIAGVCSVVPDGETPFHAGCDDAVVDIVLDGSGTITFKDDLTYEASIQITSAFDVHFPAGCADSCTNIGMIDGVECVDSDDGGCDCTGELEPAPDTASGTYVAEGDTLTMTAEPDQGEEPMPEENEYCVDGDTLTVRQMGRDGSINTFVATRQ
jgi:hypothetical protein